ncbi:hypothetical protein OSTOST_17313 [Ostertagia ostertagi]
MGRGGGYFVVDEKCRKWLDYYGKLREQYVSSMWTHFSRSFMIFYLACAAKRLCCIFGYLILRSYAVEEESQEEMAAQLAQVEEMLSAEGAVREPRAVGDGSEAEPSPQREDAATDDELDDREDESDQPVSSFSEEYDSSEERPVHRSAGERGLEGVPEGQQQQQEVIAGDHEMAEVPDVQQAVIEGEHEIDQVPEEQPVLVVGEHELEDVLEEQPGVEAEVQQAVVEGEHEMEQEPEAHPGVETGEHAMEQEAQEQLDVVAGDHEMAEVAEEQPGVVTGEHEQEQEPEQVEPEVEEELPMIADPAKVLDYMRMHNRRACVGADLGFLHERI